MSKQFSITRDEMYAWMTEAHESITNVMTEDTGVMIGIIRDSMAEDAMWWETSGTITDTDIIEVLEEWRADNRVEETTPTTPDTTPPTAGRRPDADRTERAALASMFCWNMALEAETKRRRAIDAGDDEGAKRWLTTVAHYLKNYARLQYGDK
jgi:hypothetical protein